MMRTLFLALVVFITFAITFPLPPGATLLGWADRNNGLARRMYLIARDPLYPKEVYERLESIATTERSFTFSPSPVTARPTIHPAVTLTEKEALLPKELYHRATATTTSTSSFLILRRDEPSPTSSTTSALILKNYAAAETTSTTSALILERDDLRQYVHRTVSPTPTTSQINIKRANAASTAEDAIATKSDVANCNYRGYASDTMNSNYYLSAANAATVLVCQLDCWNTDACETYSFQSTNTTNLPNCNLYSGIFDNRNLFVISDPESPTYFSAKYPNDGSNYCFGDTDLLIEEIPSSFPILPRFQSLAEWIWGRL